jgi:hypothetical protein
MSQSYGAVTVQAAQMSSIRLTMLIHTSRPTTTREDAVERVLGRALDVERADPLEQLEQHRRQQRALDDAAERRLHLGQPPEQEQEQRALVSDAEREPTSLARPHATTVSRRPSCSKAKPVKAPVAAEMPIDSSTVTPRPARTTTSLAFLTRKLPSLTLWCQIARIASRSASTQPRPE